MMKLQLSGHCYVLLQGDWIHPIAHHQHNLLWYPERWLRMQEQYMYRPYEKSVVTENPWIISLYDRQRVFVVSKDNGKWTNPNYQTFGASLDVISSYVLEIPSSVAAMVLDGGKGYSKFIKEYNRRIKKANKYFCG